MHVVRTPRSLSVGILLKAPAEGAWLDAFDARYLELQLSQRALARTAPNELNIAPLDAPVNADPVDSDSGLVFGAHHKPVDVPPD
jgi:hypothetical protein